MNEKELLAYADMLEGCEAEFATKALDYMDGKQEQHLVCVLNDPSKGRRRWQQRGIVPRVRNLTKMIVEKSGLLFNDAAPVLNVYKQGMQEPDERETGLLMDYLDETEWQEFFINVDKVTRLLKTSIVLIQFDEETQALNFDILHRGNCAVILNSTNKNINTLVYEVGDVGDNKCAYRIFTADTITDFTIDCKTKTVVYAVDQDNPFGVVPAVPFYDTGIPRTGFWAEAPSDLVSINELYNLHITDSEFAISWSKLKTLFTNTTLASDNSLDLELTARPNSNLPRFAPDEGAMIGGPGVAVQITTNGGETPYVEYKGPDVNIEPLDNVVNSWIRDFAGDWSVRMKASGEGVASSGFQLIVEEMDNLDLRKTRQRMFEAGFKRFFRVVKSVVNTVKPGTFSDDSSLFAEFKDPALPVDQKAQEEVWNLRIANGRASRIDYFMQVYGMSKDEAVAKMDEIDAQVQVSSKPKSVGVVITRDSSGVVG